MLSRVSSSENILPPPVVNRPAVSLLLSPVLCSAVTLTTFSFPLRSTRPIMEAMPKVLFVYVSLLSLFNVCAATCKFPLTTICPPPSLLPKKSVPANSPYALYAPFTSTVASWRVITPFLSTGCSAPGIGLYPACFQTPMTLSLVPVKPLLLIVSFNSSPIVSFVRLFFPSLTKRPYAVVLEPLVVREMVPPFKIS